MNDKRIKKYISKEKIIIGTFLVMLMCSSYAYANPLAGIDNFNNLFFEVCNKIGWMITGWGLLSFFQANNAQDSAGKTKAMWYVVAGIVAINLKPIISLVAM